MTDLRLATRGSPLALAQSDRVAERLLRAHGDLRVERVVVRTSGDEQLDASLSEIGGTGVFTAAVDRAVAEGRADCAVHSAKDLPASLAEEGIVLAAVPERADVRDCLVGSTLAGLSTGATVASGSGRRRAQLAATRPDLVFVDLRGNMSRRLSLIPPGGAVVVALAALERLGLLERVDEVLETATMLPQVGQGALALTCRSDDDETRRLLGSIDNADLHRCLIAERAFLASLGAGCTAPLAGLALIEERDILLSALLARPDGSAIVRDQGRGNDPVALGGELASRLVARARSAGIDGIER